jgi:SAM-dependent methyltransferase
MADLPCSHGKLCAVERGVHRVHLVGMEAAMQVFDHARLAQARARAGAARAELAMSAFARLLDRLDDTTRRFESALVLGAGAEAGAALRARGIGQVASADLAPCLAPDMVCGTEAVPFAAAAFDLIVAPWHLHWVNDLPGLLRQLRQALRPDGLLLANLPALGTLAELRDALTGAEAELTGRAAPRVSPFADLRDGAGLLQRAGFALPVADADRLTLAYREPLALLAELRAAGETNCVLARARQPLRRAVLAEALARLPRGNDGRVPVSLVAMTLTGWAPAPSQPRALRPGSATTRLAEALGASEQPAGEAPAGLPHPPATR